MCMYVHGIGDLSGSIHGLSIFNQRVMFRRSRVWKITLSTAYPLRFHTHSSLYRSRNNLNYFSSTYPDPTPRCTLQSSRPTSQTPGQKTYLNTSQHSTAASRPYCSSTISAPFSTPICAPASANFTPSHSFVRSPEQNNQSKVGVLGKLKHLPFLSLLTS